MSGGESCSVPPAPHSAQHPEKEKPGSTVRAECDLEHSGGQGVGCLPEEQCLEVWNSSRGELQSWTPTPVLQIPQTLAQSSWQPISGQGQEWEAGQRLPLDQ